MTIHLNSMLNRKATRLIISTPEDGGCVLCFSYDTLVGLHVGSKTYGVENAWNTTTGRHMNELGCHIKSPDVIKVDSVDALGELALEAITKATVQRVTNNLSLAS